MPMVAAYIKDSANVDEDELFLACRQLAPAAYTTPRHPVTPGSINFFPHRVRNEYQGADVVVSCEGFFFHDRAEIIDEVKTPLLFGALKSLFPDLTFSNWPKLVQAGWASDVEDAEFEGDLEMAAAVERAQSDIAKFRDYQSRFGRDEAIDVAMMEEREIPCS